MPAPEFALWREYHRRYGLPHERIEWAIANAGSAICGSWGSRVRPKDLIPEFVVERGMSVRALSAELAALPGAKVELVSADEMARRRKASRTI